MTIGSLRKRIALQAEAQISDGAGGYALTWVTLATVWADIRPVSGMEISFAGHLESRVTHKVRIRWRNDVPVTSDMRFSWGGRAFNIRAVLNVRENNRYMMLLVEEGGAV